MQTNFVFMCGFHRSNAIVAHQGYQYHERCLGRHVVTARQDESGYNFSRSCCSSRLIKWSCAFVTHVLEYILSYMCNTAYLIPNTICLH